MQVQDKITFQPRDGYKELLKKVADRDDRPMTYIINRYIEAGLKADGLLPETRQPRS